MALESLDEEEYQRVLDLRRIYGSVGAVSEYLGVRRPSLEIALIRHKGEQLVGLRSEVTTRMRRGLRQYWKPWMGKHRLTPEKK